MIRDEPAGEGTYRVHADFPWTIDVPAGIRVSARGFVILYPVTPDPDLSTHILPAA